MDCTTVRTLLGFARAGELDDAERGALQQHLDACADCAAHSLNEQRFDDALAAAMPRVPVPSGLKSRVLIALAQARRPRPWPWLAAASLLLAAGIGWYIWQLSTTEVDVEVLISKVDGGTAATPDAVESWFSEQRNISMQAPREFNFELLESYDDVDFQGRRVPRLTFFSRGDRDNRASLAHVYVLSSSHFHLPGPLQGQHYRLSTATHHIEIRDLGEFIYLIIHTGSSLEPFLRRAA